MRNVRTLGALALLAVTGCASMKVQSDHDPGMSFGEFRTYQWVELEASESGGDLGFDSPLMARRIQESVHAELASLGYRPAASGRPDFRISYRMLAREEVEQYTSGHLGHSPHGHRGFGHGFGHHGLGYGSSLTRNVVRCVLVLDVWDGPSGQLVWRGWARWRLGEDPSAEKVAEHINRAVHRILSQFPPEAAGPEPLLAEG